MGFLSLLGATRLPLRREASVPGLVGEHGEPGEAGAGSAAAGKARGASWGVSGELLLLHEVPMLERLVCGLVSPMDGRLLTVPVKVDGESQSTSCADDLRCGTAMRDPLRRRRCTTPDRLSRSQEPGPGGGGGAAPGGSPGGGRQWSPCFTSRSIVS